MADQTTLIEALRARAADLVILKDEFGIKHADGIALLQTVWNYDLAMKQIGRPTGPQMIKSEESHGQDN